MANYSLDSISANCYPGTTVLINKLGIRNENVLRQAELEITQEAAATWEQSPLCNAFDFEHYKAIHRHLFHELYDWAGQIRDVDISKKGTKFFAFAEIEDGAARMFERMQKLNCFKGFCHKRFVAEFMDFYDATNRLHPFREGNGRTQRLFLAQLARNAGYSLDFADIDADELMITTIQSAQGVTDGLERIFGEAVKPIKPEHSNVVPAASERKCSAR
jgi:cell filamentation protein